MKKTKELVSNLQGVMGALSGLDGEVGEAAASIGKAIDAIVKSSQEGSKKSGGSWAAVASGVVDLINMAVTASKKRKQAEREHILEQIAFAREYALALNDQLRLQGELSGGGFIRDYGAEIESAYAAMTDATTKYNAAMEKLEEGRAKTDRKDVIDGNAVLKGAAIGVTIGTVIPGVGNAIGAVVGGVVGGIVGLFSKKSKDIFSGLLQVYPDLIDANGDLNTSLAETLITTNQVDDKTKELLTDTIEWQNAIDEAKEAVSDIVMELAGDLGNSIHNALKEAFEAGEDAGTRMFDALNSPWATSSIT